MGKFGRMTPSLSMKFRDILIPFGHFLSFDIYFFHRERILPFCQPSWWIWNPITVVLIHKVLPCNRTGLYTNWFLNQQFSRVAKDFSKMLWTRKYFQILNQDGIAKSWKSSEFTFNWFEYGSGTTFLQNHELWN